ncbi:MAG: sigma-54-dependent Fis family transcriptional regulator [Phycisphaeraceae bacterium]|nr:sigma-54-dependent Fis family transcriptional regulator [Phycisphaeraceae bacterium]
MADSRTNSDRRLAAQVLIVEDEPDHADVMAESLKKPGHVCTIVNGVADAMQELHHGTFDVIITDLRMPPSAGVRVAVGPGVGEHEAVVAADGGDAGLIVLRAARHLQPNAETIMVTAHGDVATARAAFKEGAYDFIEKPLDLDVFRNLVNRAAETVLLRHESADLGLAGGADELVQHDGFEGIIAGSEPMRRILRTVKTVAVATMPVLITGESGTGKELIAQAVHRNSPRGRPRAEGGTGGRFVALNCAAETETLLEDQLFGHVRGAFTGAERDREGVFEYADKGTLFLDEIGDMPLKMQAKLLRVLESGEVVRVGSNEPRRVDVRLVSATNKDLKAMCATGAFREDLYFRIKGSQVHLPPLRERREDIPRIVRHAIARYTEQVLGKGGAAAIPPDITDVAMMRLTSYNWPGNVRQLLNVVQNMVVMALGEAGGGVGSGGKTGAVVLDVRHIPDEIVTGDTDEADAMSSPGSVGSLAGTSLEQIEKRAIRETLRLTAGNREKAAELLGIGERTLYRKLKEYGLR